MHAHACMHTHACARMHAVTHSSLRGFPRHPSSKTYPGCLTLTCGSLPVGNQFHDATSHPLLHVTTLKSYCAKLAACRHIHKPTLCCM